MWHTCARTCTVTMGAADAWQCEATTQEARVACTPFQKMTKGRVQKDVNVVSMLTSVTS